MRILLTSAFLLAMASPSMAWQAGPFPYDWVRVCGWHAPGHPARCHCVKSSSRGGKAEIHKKNVPTVQPNKSPGPND